MYNVWLALGAGLSLAGLAGVFLLRKTRYRETVLKLAFLPLCFTFSLLLVLAGRYDRVYDASYYLSGILILTGLLYLLFLAVLDIRRRRKAV